MYQLVVPPDQAISPVSDGAEGHGKRDVLSEPAVHAVQPEALQLLEALRRGVRRPGPVVNRHLAGLVLLSAALGMVKGNN
jgi:hypothetical protein